MNVGTTFVPSIQSFPSRRSVVMSSNGMIACSHPLAAQVGIDLLKRGGNAVDAAIGIAATLCVVEPMSTGIGGDVFALVWQAKDAILHALNGSGRAPTGATVEFYRQRGCTEMPRDGLLSLTVPGAVDAWCTLLERFGQLPLRDLLRPAIDYAHDGFPVTELVAESWQRAESKLSYWEDTRETFLPHGSAPAAGERFSLPRLARSLELISQGGREAFYGGPISHRIASFCRENGGLITEADLARHSSTWVSPISTNYRGYDVYECPPNGQGLAALLALNLVESFDIADMGHNSEAYLHLLIEAMKLGFGDAYEYVADPEHSDIPLDRLLSKGYSSSRRATIRERAASEPRLGSLGQGSDTVYFTVVDQHRNAVSFINSLYSSFGSGVTIGDTGILLQNRGSGFTLQPGHRNCIAPGKRPYHTIIPSIVLRDGDPLWIYGVMGGGMQPQGHLQVICNLVDFGMNVQEAMDAPRFRFLSDNRVALEDAVGTDVRKGLVRRSHEIVPNDQLTLGYGGGQIIQIDPISGLLYGGSDPRKDGHAVGY